MSTTGDTAGVLLPPPLAWLLAFAIGLAANWLLPWHFVPAGAPKAWIGAGILAAGILLALWAVLTFRRAGTRVEPYKPTTAIVTTGPYRLTRNPIYLGMFLGQAGLAVGFDSLWLLVTLVLFFLVIRFGVVAREEAYLARKFPADFARYKARVRRWL